MRPHFMIFFLILSLLREDHGFQDSITQKKNRRILHQPFFPASSAPPPQPELSPPPPADQDQPFFHELPDGSTTPDQIQQSPEVPATGNTVGNPVATQPSKPSKKLAIAIPVGILTLGMMSALAFYLYKHVVKHSGESQKLVGCNSRRIKEDTGVEPSTFLYVGTVDPSNTQSVCETSTSQTFNSEKKIDHKRYRPSPDLQPLPPLNKPPPPPSIDLSPAMSFSDDEDTTFYSAQASSLSNMSPSSKPDHVVSHTKRTPNYHLSRLSSPDEKYAVIPTDDHLRPPCPSPPPPPQLEEQLSISAQPYVPKRPKFPAPPPPPDIGRLQWISNDVQQASTIPVPPPPPMPTSRKLSAVKGTTSLASTPIRSQSRSPSPRVTPKIKKTSPIKEVREVTEGICSSQKQVEDYNERSKPKLKAFHWDKVRTTSDRATVWDQLKSSSFQLNEDEMESLFGWSSANSAPKEASRKQVLPPQEMENRVLDPKKSQNIAILLRALNVTRDEVSEALLDGNPEGLGPDLLETLMKMAPTKEEEIKLKGYNGDISKLGTAERFLKAVLDIPFAFKRVEAMLYRANFDKEVKYLRKSFLTIEEASEELKNSRLFLKLLEAVLKTGNRMNVGTNRGEARAFRLDTLLKLADVKGTDGKTTLLHFVVQEILRSEGEQSDPDFIFQDEDEFKKQGLQVVAGLTKELGNVRRAAGMDSDVLSSYVSKLETGLEKFRLVLEHEKQNRQGKFFDSMQVFLNEAQEEINRVKVEETRGLLVVKELTEYFHGDAAKEEAHPFRIFMIVRDFLSTLDNVCRDVGTRQERTTIGAARSFRIPVTASLPVLNRYNVEHDRSSDDESLSS